MHPLLLDQIPTPDWPSIVGAVGGDMGFMQSDCLNNLSSMLYSYQGVFLRLRKEMREKSRLFRTLVLRNNPSYVHLIKVVNWTNVLASAAILVGAGAALIAAAAAAPVIFGVGVVTSLVAAALYGAGLALVGIGAYLGIQGMYNALISQGFGGAPIQPNPNCDLTMPCMI